MDPHQPASAMASPDPAAPVHPNHRYAIDFALKMIGPTAKVLDYGCGAGESVAYGRSIGLDIVGADVFYDGAQSRQIAEAEGLFGTVVFEMTDSRLPFEDAKFDLVFANFVFEHVKDIDRAVAEVRRVLKPGGAFLNLFPTMGVLREGHCGIPLAHWLNRLPSLQIPYLFIWRCAGFGHYKAGKTRRQWARDFSKWLGDYTNYRTRRSIMRAYGRQFDHVERLEADFLAYRLEAKGMNGGAKLARSTWFAPVSRFLTYRLASAVLLAR
jgi:SAM-dependent methyltransferase